jgi:hypothetical protein
MTLLELTSAQAAMVAVALAEAEQYRRDLAKAWCAACATAPGGACMDHLAFVGHADAYRILRDSLAEAMPTANSRPRCSEHRGRL